jgi:hypothetical protein
MSADAVGIHASGDSAEEAIEDFRRAIKTRLGGIMVSCTHLQMNIYLELSRPAGDVSRWEKVFNYPLKQINCLKAPILRELQSKINKR